MDLKEVIDRTDIRLSIPIDETEVEAEAEAVTARLQYNADKVAIVEVCVIDLSIKTTTTQLGDRSLL